MIVSGGKGWEASVVSCRLILLCACHLRYFLTQGQSQILAQLQNAGFSNPHERRRDAERHRDPDRRRASQQGAIIPPSPALVRHGSKQRKIPAALVPGTGASPGHLTPLSAAAHVNVPVGTPQHRASVLNTQHPYANVPGYDYGRDLVEDYNGPQYGRASPMVSSVGAAPPAISNVRARAGDVGVSNGGGYQGQEDDRERPKNSLIKILTCRCG
jgi:casein kinase 1